MKVTSAQAAKILRSLINEFNDLMRLESKASLFIAAVGEDPESVRPAYSFEETREKAKKLNEQIRTLKHAINVFNSTTKVPGFDMTVDEVLVFLPQLNADVSRLGAMKSVLPKEREYREAADTLAKLQLALDTVNSTVEFEVNI